MILTVPLGLLTQLSGQPQGVVSALIVSALSLVLLIIYNKWFSPEFDGVFKAHVPVKEILMVSSAMAILIIGCIIINAIYSGLAFKPSVSFVCLALMARYSILKGLTYSVLLSALLWVFSREMFGILVSGSVLDETVYLMRCTVIVYVLNTFVCYYLAYFQAIGKNRIVYSISVVLNIVTLPHFYLLGIVFGARGIFILDQMKMQRLHQPSLVISAKMVFL